MISQHMDHRLMEQIKGFIRREYGCYDVQMITEKDKIVQIVCEAFGQPKDLVLSKCRKREYVMPKQVIQVCLKRCTKMSLTEIGLFAGEVDHVTVMHSIRTVNNLMETDKEYRAKVIGIFKSLKIDNI